MNNFIFPKPAHDDTFEDMTRDILSRDFRNPNIQRYGRKGQKQDGIDIVGIAGLDHVRDELVGGQCKNHVAGISDNKLQKEIEDELEKFERNKLPIKRFLFFTSADNSKNVIDFVDELNRKRLEAGKCPVEIYFWDYFTDKLMVYPDLMYKYFTRLLPTQKAENMTIPDLNKSTRETLSINADQLAEKEIGDLREQLLKVTDKNMHGLKKEEKYNLYVGLSTKKDISFKYLVDIEVNFSDLFDDEEKLEEKFDLIKNALKHLVSVVSQPSISKKLVLYVDIEISLAFLLGRILRKHKFEAEIVFKDKVWSSNQNLLPYVPADITEKLPQISEVPNNDGVFIFNAVNRSSAERDVISHVESYKEMPRILVSYKISAAQISSSAHALSVAKAIVDKIHMLESWNIKKTHLFLIVPKPLAFLIGYLLNTLNSTVYLHFMDGTRTKYLVSGAVDNNTF